jgi:hypothetical protein
MMRKVFVKGILVLSLMCLMGLVGISNMYGSPAAEKPDRLPESALHLTRLAVYDGEFFSGESGGFWNVSRIYFRPTTYSYEVSLSEEIQGIKIEATPVPPGTTIEFETDAYWPNAIHYTKNGKGSNTSFNFGNWPAGMATFETIGPWQTSYNGPFTVNATIRVVDNNYPDNYLEYKVALNLRDGRPYYNLFDSYEANDGYVATTGVTIPFNIYIPKNPPPQPGEKLPVVYVLHGNTCRLQPVDFVIKRYPAAPIWAKDSEENPSKRCIILAPQRTELDFTDYYTKYTADNKYEPPAFNTGVPATTGWYEWGANPGRPVGLTPFGEGAYEALQHLIAGTLVKQGVYDYSRYAANIDTRRIYVTGLSMGGAGTLGTMIQHGDTFAAAFANCPLFPLSETNAVALKNKPFWFNHGVMDHVEVNNSLLSYARLQAAGNTNVHKTIFPDTYFMFENHHYTWVPAYYYRFIREWLFQQSKP